MPVGPGGHGHVTKRAKAVVGKVPGKSKKDDTGLQKGLEKGERD